LQLQSRVRPEILGKNTLWITPGSRILKRSKLAQKRAKNRTRLRL
jgi:hypothetical protein